MPSGVAISLTWIQICALIPYHGRLVGNLYWDRWVVPKGTFASRAFKPVMFFCSLDRSDLLSRRQKAGASKERNGHAISSGVGCRLGGFTRLMNSQVMKCIG